MTIFQPLDFKPKQSLGTWFASQPLDLSPKQSPEDEDVSKVFQYHSQQSQKTKVDHTHGFLVHLKTPTLQLELKLPTLWS
jgi:hypothetical protein